jgi:hypothetical protein
VQVDQVGGVAIVEFDPRAITLFLGVAEFYQPWLLGCNLRRLGEQCNCI